MDAMDDAAFPSFLCPIGREIMRDPVNCADGHSYERASIERWLATNNTSPRTGAQLPNKVLIPNHALRSSIEEWHSTPAAKVLHEATDAATQIVKAAQADASRMRGEAAKEVATFLKASLSSPEQQSLCAESTRQAAAIIKAARDQPRSGKMRLKAVADARRRRRESVLQWHRKKAVAGSGGGGGSAAAMSLSIAAPAPAASSTVEPFSCISHFEGRPMFPDARPDADGGSDAAGDGGLRAGDQRGRGAGSAAGAVADRHVPAGPSPFHHSSVQRPGAKLGAPMGDPGSQYEPQGPLPGGAVPMASGGPTAQDAIAYLCQVKIKFERQPQIYNKVCACAAHRWRVRRTPEPHVAPSAIVMDILVRASRTRTRRHTDEMHARPVTVPRHHEGVQGAEHRHAGRHRPRAQTLLWPPRAHSRLQHLPGAPDAPCTGPCTAPSTAPRYTPAPPQ